MTTRPVGVGHLTMLDAAPPDWVRLAHDAGFEAVGLRISPAGAGEDPWPMTAGSAMLAATLSRLAETGTAVQDVEIITLGPGTRAERQDPLFEVGAELGARFFNVMVTDPDLRRAHDTFAALCERAAPYGLRPCLEGISYMAVRDVRTARSVLAGTGGGLIVDPLHLQRAGDGVADVRAVERAALGYLQLCDGPLRTPTGIPRPRQMPRGQGVDDDIRRLESRAGRLLPGEGEMPLAEIAAALPPDLPVSVEAPNVQLLESLGPAGFLRRARRAAGQVLDEAARLTSRSGHDTGPGPAEHSPAR
jgi:sugar phosphate isomerase/epimerase